MRVAVGRGREPIDVGKIHDRSGTGGDGKLLGRPIELSTTLSYNPTTIKRWHVRGVTLSKPKQSKDLEQMAWLGNLTSQTPDFFWSHYRYGIAFIGYDTLNVSDLISEPSGPH